MTLFNQESNNYPLIYSKFSSINFTFGFSLFQNFLSCKIHKVKCKMVTFSNFLEGTHWTQHLHATQVQFSSWVII